MHYRSNGKGEGGVGHRASRAQRALRVGLTAILTVLLLVTLSGLALSATYYVNSGTGSDENDGSQAQPWATIAAGETKGVLLPGDTVVVTGTFGPTTLSTSAGVEGSPITYLADNAVIDCNNSQTGLTIAASVVHHVVIDGFEIKGANVGTRFTSGAHDLVLRNCYLHDINNGANWEGCACWDNGTADNLYAGNIISGVGSDLMYEAINGCIVLGGGSANTKIYNNTLDNGTNAVRLWSGATGAKFKNNIVVNMRWVALHSDDVPASIESNYNIFYNNVKQTDAGIRLGTYDAVTDPLFVPGTYELSEGSPAVESGIDVGLPYNGTSPDMGAIESGYTIYKGFVAGIVTHVGNANSPGGPVVGAIVATVDGGTSVLTDSNGSYMLRLPVGIQQLKASCGHVESDVATVNVIVDETATQNFVLDDSTVNTYYVKQDGDDYADGKTLETAWATISNGDMTGCLRAGDMVVVAAGAYSPVALSQCSGNGLGSIIYKANGVVQMSEPTGSSVSGFTISAGSVAKTVIDGFDISGGRYGIYLSGCSEITVRNCYIHDINVIGSAEGAGLWDRLTADCKYINNRFYNVGLSTNTSPNGCICIGGSSTTTIYNNVFDTATNAIRMWDSTQNVIYKNNISAHMRFDFSVNSDQGYGSLTKDYNLYDGKMPAANLNVNEFIADPLFVPGTHQLAELSPAVDAGVDVGLAYQGTAPDLGAYESPYTSVSVSGYVTSTLSGLPVIGATVATLDGVATTKTGKDGRFRFRLPLGQVTLVAGKSGYDSDQETVTLVLGANTVNFSLQQVAQPYSGQTLWDAAAEWSQTANPTGAWAFGYLNPAEQFVLYTEHVYVDGTTGEGWRCPGNWDRHGNYSRNYGDAPFENWSSFREVHQLTPGSPQRGGEKTTARWTCPANGLYKYYVRFTGQSTAWATVDTYVLTGGLALSQGPIWGFIGRSINNFTDGEGSPREQVFTGYIELTAAEALDFAFDHGPNNANADCTGVAATVEKVSGLPNVGTIADARSAEEGTAITCSGIVSAAFADFFYIETADRSSGIRVDMSGHGCVEGQSVTVIGTAHILGTGERSITTSNVIPTGTGAITPLGMTNKNVVADPLSLGLLVKTWGEVTSVNDYFLTIDDGSGKMFGVSLVDAGISLTDIGTGDFVSVVGPVGLETYSGTTYTTVRLRSIDDISKN